MIERQRHKFYYEKNLRAINDKEFIAKIKAADEKVVKIDKDIIIQGVKNPLTTIYLGFSTRCIHDAMKRKKKRVDIAIAIEPDVGVFKNMLYTEDITDLLEDKDFDFIVGFDNNKLMPELFQALTKIHKGEDLGRAVKLMSMEKIADPFQFPKEDDPIPIELDDIVRRTEKQIKVSMGCSDDTFIRWEMMFENRFIMKDAWSIKDLFGKFKDVPAVVCGGGPSLDDFITHYKEHKPNILIIACDAVLKKLLDSGIKPHMVTRCERKETTIFKGVTKEMTEGIYYCAYPWTPANFFKLFDDIFYLFRNNGSCIYASYDHGNVDGGVSAANAGLELAILMGCKDIIFTGIDLGFIDGKSHTEGTEVEFNPEHSKKLWKKVKANDGSEVTTIPVWDRCCNEYAQSIHKGITKGKKFTVYNTSPKGCFIEGTVYKPWSELTLDGYKDKIVDLIEKHRRKVPKKDWESFTDRNKKAHKELLNMKECVASTQRLVLDAHKTKDREINKIIKKTRSECEGFDLVKALRSHKHNYEKLWRAIANTYDDNFRKKIYYHPIYRVIVMDILQLDFYHHQNHINSIVNTMEDDDQRCELYTERMRDWLVKVDHYIDELTELLEREGDINDASEETHTLDPKQKNQDPLLPSTV